MKKLLLIIALVFISGCVGQTAKIDVNNGVIIEKFIANPADVFDFQTVTFSVDVSNVGGTTANDVKVKLLGVEGAWRQASSSDIVSEISKGPFSLKPPNLKDNIPGDSRFSDFTLTAPDLNEGDKTSFPVKARVEFTYSTTGTVIIKAISLNQQQIMQRKGESVLDAVKESNSDGPLKFKFVRGATPLVIDPDEGGTIEREFRFEISNVGQGWPISDNTVGKIGSSARGNKLVLQAPSGISLTSCDGISGSLDGFYVVLRSDGRAPVSCTVRINTADWRTKTEGNIVFKFDSNYNYFVEDDVSISVQGTKRSDVPARGAPVTAPGATPIPGTTPTPAPVEGPPVLVLTNPSNGATGVAMTITTIQGIFNKELDVNSISNVVTVFGSKEGTTIAGTTSLGENKKTLIFSPAAALKADSKYTITIAKSLKSTDGFNLENVITFTFTTAAADTTAPTISLVSPALDAVLTTRTPVISVKTNEAATCRILSTGQTLSTADSLTHSLTLTLTADGQQTYIIRCKDNAGNEAAANDITIRFTVDATAPTVLSTTPTNNATGVSRTAQINITFSEAMDTATTEAAFSISPSVGGTKTWNSQQTQMFFAPSAAMTASTEHTVTVAATAKDKAGNALAAYTFKFTTAS